jgi:signal transduction histidine kinase
MDIVVRETDRLNTIITEFLEYARPESTLVEQIELLSVLDETIMLLKNSKNFTDTIRITSDVAPHIQLKGNAQRLRQVFWNLLINACQAMPQGGMLSVKAASFPHADDDTLWCEIEITDTGRGIEKEHLGKIFDPFFTTKTGGTGLGLSIAYRIIEDHRGTISVESEPGRGTRFRVRLPMTDDQHFAGLHSGRPAGNIIKGKP